MFLPPALERGWAASQPHVEVATLFVRSDVESRRRLFVAIAAVSAAHPGTPRWNQMGYVDNAGAAV